MRHDSPVFRLSTLLRLPSFFAKRIWGKQRDFVMIGGGRTVGLGLIIGSSVLLIAFITWLFTAFSTNETSTGGLTIGLVLAVALFAPIFGIGAYLFRRASTEKADFAAIQQQKKLLNMVLTQGQVTIAEIVAELEVSRDLVEDMIRDLVGKQLFSGAINWDKGVLYSVESQAVINDRKCPNCGGVLTFAGKGLVVCPYCGSEVFLTKRAASQTVT